MIRLLTALALVLPLSVSAATFKELVDDQIVPFVDTLISLFYALAFIFFLIGVVRFFMSPSEEAREKGKKFAFWGIIGFVVLFSVWGFVRLLLSLIGA